MRALIVEDNRDFAQILQHICEVKGCIADIAHTAATGLERAFEQRPDVVLCDIGLPGDMNGLDFARKLKSTEALSDIPLIAISGHTSEEDRMQALQAGFQVVLPKPVKFADLSQALSLFATNSESDT